MNLLCLSILLQIQIQLTNFNPHVTLQVGLKREGYNTNNLIECVWKHVQKQETTS